MRFVFDVPDTIPTKKDAERLLAQLKKLERFKYVVRENYRLPYLSVFDEQMPEAPGMVFSISPQQGEDFIVSYDFLADGAVYKGHGFFEDCEPNMTWAEAVKEILAWLVGFLKGYTPNQRQEVAEAIQKINNLGEPVITIDE